MAIYAHSDGLGGVQILEDENKFTLTDIRETRSLEDGMFLSSENVL
jgi:hypothetical protein